MPLRCRNFHNDGSVKQTCRQGSSCRFVHPDQPEWESANRYTAGRGRADFVPRETRAHPSSWGAPPPPSSSSRPGPSRDKFSAQASGSIKSSWDTVSWGAPGYDDGSSQPSTSLRNDAVSDRRRRPSSTLEKAKDMGWGDRGWGSKGDKSHSWRDSDSSNTSKGWGRKEHSAKDLSYDEKDDGWASKVGDSWAKTTSSGWDGGGKGTWGTEASGSSTGWGGIDVAASSWVSSETGNANKRANAEGESIRGSSWGNSTSGWGSQLKLPPPPQPLVSTAEVRRERPRISIPPPLQPQADKGQGIEEGLKSSRISPAAILPQLTEEDIRTSLAPLKVQPLTIEADEPAPKSALPESAHPTSEHLNTAQKYSITIRVIVQAVMFQIDLDFVQGNIDRWKRTQNSQQFSRATPATQVLLNAQLSTYVQEAIELRKRLDATIKRLSNLTDVSLPSINLPTEINGQALLAYSIGLRNWIQALQSVEEASVDSPDTDNKPQKAKDPLESIWDQIQAGVFSMEDCIDTITAILHDGLLTIDVDSKVVVLRESREARRRDKVAALEASMKEALDETNRVGDDLKELAKETVALKETVYQNNLIFTQLDAELDSAEKINAQAQKFLTQMETWKQEDEVRIQELTTQLQSLHSVSSSSASPINVEDLVSRAQTLFLDNLMSNITALFNKLREACSENNRSFIAEVFQQVQLVVDKTNEIDHRANEITPKLQASG